MNAKSQVRSDSRDRRAQAEKEKAKAKTKTGEHDNTVVSMDSTDDETTPPPIKKISLCQRITQVYEKQVAETKASRPDDQTRTTPSAQLDVVKYAEHVEGPTDPLEAPVTLDNVQTVSLRDLLAEEDKAADTNLDEKISLNLFL